MKPHELVSSTEVAETFEWVHNVTESLGWRFEIASEQSPVLLGNVRFLAGYRRPQSIDEPALRALRATHFDNVTFGGAVRTGIGAEPLVRAALLQHFTTKAHARQVVVAWCHDFYNSRHRHSTAALMSPIQYERLAADQRAAA